MGCAWQRTYDCRDERQGAQQLEPPRLCSAEAHAVRLCGGLISIGRGLGFSVSLRLARAVRPCARPAIWQVLLGGKTTTSNGVKRLIDLSGQGT